MRAIIDNNTGEYITDYEDEWRPILISDNQYWREIDGTTVVEVEIVRKKELEYLRETAYKYQQLCK